MISTLLVAALAAAPASPPAGPPPAPSDAQCQSLGMPRGPLAFSPGELLEFDVDALGAQAGQLELRTLPRKGNQLPVRADVRTNTFFNKVRKVTGQATSTLDARTLRPIRYEESTVEGGYALTADVAFTAADRSAALQYTVNGSAGARRFSWAQDGLDVLGAIYLLRQVPLKPGLPLCFDAYGVRHMWRVFGKVAGREHLSTRVGEFEAWHITGWAVRKDVPGEWRELHLWVSDDARRLPLVAVGAIDLGAVRAVLAGFTRPGDKAARADRGQSLKW
jgi:hypothetical protein